MSIVNFIKCNTCNLSYNSLHDFYDEWMDVWKAAPRQIPTCLKLKNCNKVSESESESEIFLINVLKKFRFKLAV